MKKDKLFLACKIILAVLYLAIIAVFYLAGIPGGFIGLWPNIGFNLSLLILVIFTVIQAAIYHVSTYFIRRKKSYLVYESVAGVLLFILIPKILLSTFSYWIIEWYLYDIAWLNSATNSWAKMYMSATYFGLTVIAFIFEILGAVKLIKINKMAQTESKE